MLSNALHLFWNVFITRLPCQKFCPHRGRIVLGCFATRTRIQWSPNQWWKWKRVSFPTGEQLRLINISSNDSLPSVPFEMIMGRNAFFMFFNYKYKNTKSNFFFYFRFFHLSHRSSKSSPGIVREKNGREGRGPGVEVDSFVKLYPGNPDLFHSDHHLVSVLVTDVTFSKNSL